MHLYHLDKGPLLDESEWKLSQDHRCHKINEMRKNKCFGASLTICLSRMFVTSLDLTPVLAALPTYMKLRSKVTDPGFLLEATFGISSRLFSNAPVIMSWTQFLCFYFRTKPFDSLCSDLDSLLFSYFLFLVLRVLFSVVGEKISNQGDVGSIPFFPDKIFNQDNLGFIPFLLNCMEGKTGKEVQ